MALPPWVGAAVRRPMPLSSPRGKSECASLAPALGCESSDGRPACTGPRRCWNPARAGMTGGSCRISVRRPASRMRRSIPDSKWACVGAAIRREARGASAQGVNAASHPMAAWPVRVASLLGPGSRRDDEWRLRHQRSAQRRKRIWAALHHEADAGPRRNRLRGGAFASPALTLSCPGRRRMQPTRRPAASTHACRRVLSIRA